MAVALGVMVATVARAQPGDPDPDPDPGSHTAPATTTVSITYDELISAPTVTSHTFAVHGMQTGLVTATHSVQDSTIIAMPIHPFHPGELVQATATTHTTSITGQHPLAPTVWQFRVAVDSGSGLFSHGNNFGPGDDLTTNLAMGDVDGDGDLDLVTGNAGGVAAGEWNVISLNKGDGSLPVSYSFGAGVDDTVALAVGDVDGDGDLDVAVGNHAQQNRVYLNDGNGNPYDTTSSLFGTSSDSPRDLALADMDGDGDLDLVAGNYGEESVVYVNDGDGTFDTVTHTLGTSGNTVAVAVGDVDGDGDLDVAVGKYEQTNVVCINDGDGGQIYATVGGGQYNYARSDYATIPGGQENEAWGRWSFAAGRRAHTYRRGCFVWGDSTDDVVVCNDDDRWVARASGGVYFYTSSDLSTGVYLPSGGETWQQVSASDRSLKENFAPVDGQQILALLADVPITTWNYTASESGARHIGPMAQDFYAAFGVGEDDKNLSALDVNGVALAAIQGLYAQNQELAAENAAQQAQIDELEARLTALEQGGASPLSQLPSPWWLLCGLLIVGLVTRRRRLPGGRG